MTDGTTGKDCPCPKVSCPNHGNCRDCVTKHRVTDSLPFCLFPENGGDKSVAHYYKKLKARFAGNEDGG